MEPGASQSFPMGSIECYGRGSPSRMSLCTRARASESKKNRRARKKKRGKGEETMDKDEKERSENISYLHSKCR